MKLAKITGAVAAVGVAMTILTAPVALAAPGETVIPAAAALGIQGGGVLPYEFQVQKTGDWCSAAAARIALTARGKKVEQSTLASYMKVTTNGLPNIKNLESALDHYTGSQWNEGRHVSRGELQPGDLVFFGSDLHHVGIYIGKHHFVHAPGRGKPVTVNSLDDEYYAETFSSAGRFWNHLPN